MKRGTTEHPKFASLALTLGLPQYACVGLLESIWQFTARFAPTGDLAKWPFPSLCRSIGWEGEAVSLRNALVEHGWLDERGAQLLVHDWAVHADDAVHMSLARGKTRFADGQTPKTYRLPQQEREVADEYFRVHAVHTKNPRRAHGKRTASARRDVAPPSPAPPSPARAKDLPDGHPAAGTESTVPTWESYSSAYRDRYSVTPLRNGKVNTVLSRFVKLVGAGDAPAIAAYYVRSSLPYYVERLHPVEFLERDASKLHTEWKTGRTFGKAGENQLPTVAQLRARGDL